MVIGMGLPDLNFPSKAFNPSSFRAQFPALNGDSVYLDSASTSLKPSILSDATCQYYQQNTATSNRSLHQDALHVTAQIDLARQAIANYIRASGHGEIIWTRGATESINLVAQSYARQCLMPGDEIIVSDLEHHSNLLPWLIVAEQTGAKVTKWSIGEQELQSIITTRTKIVAVTQMSNVTGFCPDLKQISDVTHQNKAILVVDGAQGIVHQPIDVQLFDIDFYAFSAHKMYGPSGIGVLYGKNRLLDQMPVWHGGGKMLKQVSFDGFEPEKLPYKFEAGTPNIAGILGFYAVLKWMDSWDFIEAETYTQSLAKYAIAELTTLTDVTFYQVNHSPIIAFTIPAIHHNDIAILLSEQNIAVRTGELCAQPLMHKLGCQGVIRVSLMPYNNQEDIDGFIRAFRDALSILK